MSLSGSAAAIMGHTRFGSRWTRKTSKLRGIVPIDLERLNELLAWAKAVQHHRDLASVARRR